MRTSPSAKTSFKLFLNREPALLLVCAVLGLASGGLVGCTGTGSGSTTDGGAPCTAESDCPSTHTCSQGVCQAKGGDCGGSYCADHAFCAPDKSCKSSTDQVCDSNADCGGVFICPPDAKVCVEPCLFDTDCDVGFICNNAVGGCAECAFDTQCLDPTRPLCDGIEGRCVACNGVGQCDAGHYCDLSPGSSTRNTCLSGCLEAADCGPGPRCEGAAGSTAGRCVECTLATQAQDCSVSARPFCDPSSQLCVECTEGGQCPGGALAVCNATGRCVECVNDSHCPKGKVCDAGASSCVSGCRDDAGCPPADALDLKVCDPSAGPLGACVACKQTSDCGPGFKCKSNACVEGCDSSATCPSARPVCNLVADRCVECLRGSDCPNNLACDGQTNTCVCLDLGAQCSASAECGNPPFNGACAAVNRCVTEVECPSTGWRAISTQVCGQQCSIVNNQDTCPPGSYCRRVKFEGGSTQNLQCVPSNACI